MSKLIDHTEHNKKTDNNPKKKAKNDTIEEQTNNPFTILSLQDPDEIREDPVSYKPMHNVGEKFIKDEKEYIIKYIMTDSVNGGIKKYLYKPSSGEDKLYSGNAYNIDVLIDMKEMRERKGQPIGGKRKSRRYRRRRHKKSRKSKKSRK